MDVQLDQLRTLEAVVEEGTFEAAARALLVTPSAVSQRIKALEEQLGRVVIQRSKPVVATEAGQVLMRLARQISRLSQDAEATLGIEGATATRIPIAVNADSLATWVVPALADFAAANAVSFTVSIDDQDYSTDHLKQGTVLAAITSTSAPVQGCTVEALGSMRYRVGASPAFAERWFAGTSGSPSSAALAVAPFVVFNRKDDLQAQYLRRRLKGAETNGFPPEHFIPSSAEFLRAVQLGLGWGLLPELQADELFASGALVDLDPRHPTDVPLYWQRWNLDSALLDALSTAIRAAAKGLR